MIDPEPRFEPTHGCVSCPISTPVVASLLVICPSVVPVSFLSPYHRSCLAQEVSTLRREAMVLKQHCKALEWQVSFNANQCSIFSYMVDFAQVRFSCVCLAFFFAWHFVCQSPALITTRMRTSDLVPSNPNHGCLFPLCRTRTAGHCLGSCEKAAHSCRNCSCPISEGAIRPRGPR